jgi:hypothetical protein
MRHAITCRYFSMLVSRKKKHAENGLFSRLLKKVSIA